MGGFILPVYLFLSSGVFAAVIGLLAGSFRELSRLWVLPVSYIGVFFLQLLLFFLVIWICSLLVDPEKPQEKESPLYRFLTKRAVELVVPLLMKIHTTGTEKAPTEGRFLLVSNHLFDLDPAVFLRCFPKSQLTFVSKQENQKMFVISKYMHKLMCPLINREDDRQALKTILRCIQILKDDLASVAVFPEGYIDKKERKLHHFRSGVFKIAQRAKVPIVVCTLRNTQYLKQNILHLKRTHVYMDLLQVIQPEEYAGMNTVELANQIYETMARHLGPENVSTEERILL